jgi:type IV secretory pathway TrbD component
MLGGIPIEASALLGAVIALCWLAFASWHVVWLSLPAWSFLRYQARKDPLFLRIWAGQLVFKQGYLHG